MSNCSSTTLIAQGDVMMSSTLAPSMALFGESQTRTSPFHFESTVLVTLAA